METFILIIRTDYPNLVKLIDPLNSAMTSVRFSTFPLGMLTVILLDLFLSYDDPTVCSAVVFLVPLKYFDPVLSVSNDFPSDLMGNAHFHYTAFDNSYTDCDEFCLII